MITNFGVDFALLDKNQRVKHGLHHQRIMESHIASYAKEVIRSLTMQYIPTETITASGEQMLRERTPEELESAINRGIHIAERAYQLMAEKGWLAEVPPINDIFEKDEGSGSVGFK